MGGEYFLPPKGSPSPENCQKLANFHKMYFHTPPHREIHFLVSMSFLPVIEVLNMTL